MSRNINHSKDVNDIFLIEFIAQYPMEKISLLIEAVKVNFKKEYREGKLVSKDFKDSADIFNKIVELIATNLFNEHDDNGFPKAKQFLNNYHVDKDPDNLNKVEDITIDDIATHYIKRSEGDRSFYKWENGHIVSWPNTSSI